mgnify:CR=1 FL=1
MHALRISLKLCGRILLDSPTAGNTMQYHPHGDASINDALVQLGQKELNYLHRIKKITTFAPANHRRDGRVVDCGGLENR